MQRSLFVQIRIRTGRRLRHEEAFVVYADFCTGRDKLRVCGGRGADCAEVKIPDGVTEIGNYAFYNCDNLTMTVGRGSYAEQYAVDNGINYMYPDSMDWLND